MSFRPARSIFLLSCVALAAAAAAQPGRLEPGDPQLPSGEYYDVFEHEGRFGDTLNVTLRSSDFDAYLAILHPNGDVLLEVDDSEGEGLDVAETIALPADGTYSVVVTSAYGEETGAYLLTIATATDADPGAPDRPTVTFPSTAPEPGVVQGVVVAERTGAPIAGARITVAGYSGSGGNVVEEAVTDGEGRYRLPLVEGLYSVRGEVEVPYGDERFHLYLHPVSGHCDQAMSEPGIVADFVLRLAGYQTCYNGDPTNYHNYYGGTISVAPTGVGGLPAETLVTFTLEAIGVLIDGAGSEPITRTRTVGGLQATSGPLDQTRHLYDIPVGDYRMSAVATLPDGSFRPLFLEDGTTGARAATVYVGFEAVRMFPYGIRVAGVELFDAP